jgi:DnaK suppressor protein
MDRRHLRRFKTVLEVRQHELRLNIEHQKQYAQKSEPEPDSVDQSVSSSEKEIGIQRRNEEQGLLRMIEAALRRIQDGTFGKCLTCGNEIDMKRLQAVQWTRYCIQCQEDMER